MLRTFIQASYRYVLLGLLIAGVVCAVWFVNAMLGVLDGPGSGKVSEESTWSHAIYMISIAAVFGSFVSHIYDNAGKLKLPNISSDAVELGILYDAILGVFAAFVTVSFLTAATSTSLANTVDSAMRWRLAGLALLAGLAGSRLIPRFRETFNRRLDTIEKDFLEGKKSGTARDLYILGSVASLHGNYMEAQEYYEKALQVDPSFSEAMAGLADTFVDLADQTPQNQDVLLQKAFEYALKYEANNLTPEQRGGILLLKARILWPMGKSYECKQALQSAVENFKKAAIPNERILHYIRFNRKLEEAAKSDTAIQAIINGLGQQA